jgi:hypothetical protein
MAAYARAGGNNEIGVKLEAMEGSQAVRKRTNSRRELLYRLLGGRLVYGPIARYKIPKRTVKFPVLLVVAANCLWKATGPRAW